MTERDLLDEEPRFGKYKGTGYTWRDLIDGHDPVYVEWVIEEVDCISEELRSALEDMVWGI